MFVTLTYDAAHVPVSDNGFMTLDVKDVQDFFKRLRRKYPKNYPKIRYYVAGEYGTENKRPHYHIILFNADALNVDASWKFPSRNGRKISVDRLDKSSRVPSSAGYIHYGDVSGASVGYTLKYICKPRIIPIHARDDRVPEFALMSKGIGNNYITEAMSKWHKSAIVDRMYVAIEDGKKIAMPRYYKNKIYTEQERKIIGWNAIEKNMEKDAKIYDEKVAKYGEYNYLRMVIESHVNSFKKMYENATKNRSKA